MEIKDNLLKPLIKSVEQYGKIRFELIKLKTVDKTAKAASVLLSRLLLISVISIFIITFNFAVALWLGNILGRDYYGFLVVAIFYGIISIVLVSLHSSIKKRINESIIRKFSLEALWKE